MKLSSRASLLLKHRGFFVKYNLLSQLQISKVISYVDENGFPPPSTPSYFIDKSIQTMLGENYIRHDASVFDPKASNKDLHNIYTGQWHRDRYKQSLRVLSSRIMMMAPSLPSFPSFLNPNPLAYIIIIPLTDLFDFHHGATEILEGSHRHLTWEPRFSDNITRGFRKRVVRVPLGSALILNSETIHRRPVIAEDHNRKILSYYFIHR